MLKKFVLTATLAVAGLALAQNAVVMGAVGRGVAANEAGGRGHFNLEMRKILQPNRPPQVRGKFVFERIHQNAAERFAIVCEPVRELGVAERICEFAGPAKLRRRNAQGQVVTINGRLLGMVRDNRAPNATTGDRDVLRFRFMRENEVVVEFEGTVREGDIKVFRQGGGQ